MLSRLHKMHLQSTPLLIPAAALLGLLWSPSSGLSDMPSTLGAILVLLWDEGPMKPSSYREGKETAEQSYLHLFSSGSSDAIHQRGASYKSQQGSK